MKLRVYLSGLADDKSLTSTTILNKTIERLLFFFARVIRFAVVPLSHDKRTVSRTKEIVQSIPILLDLFIVLVDTRLNYNYEKGHKQSQLSEYKFFSCLSTFLIITNYTPDTNLDFKMPNAIEIGIVVFCMIILFAMLAWAFCWPHKNRRSRMDHSRKAAKKRSRTAGRSHRDVEMHPRNWNEDENRSKIGKTRPMPVFDEENNVELVKDDNSEWV